ncbi:hypothetical protein BJ912DRAFT_956622 [Pholiota molesta]|nr:hypothetical protein BJ912DRAFT_956622 [Pholiota molesta]
MSPVRCLWERRSYGPDASRLRGWADIATSEYGGHVERDGCGVKRDEVEEARLYWPRDVRPKLNAVGESGSSPRENVFLDAFLGDTSSASAWNLDDNLLNSWRMGPAIMSINPKIFSASEGASGLERRALERNAASSVKSSGKSMDCKRGVGGTAADGVKNISGTTIKRTGHAVLTVLVSTKNDKQLENARRIRKMGRRVEEMSMMGRMMSVLFIRGNLRGFQSQPRLDSLLSIVAGNEPE